MARSRIVLPRTGPLLALLLLVGCPPAQVEPEAAVPSSAPAAGVIQIQVDPEVKAQVAPKGPSPAEQRVLGALDEGRARAASCYQAAVARDPYLYGEVVLRLALDAQGRVLQAESVMDTVGDRELVSCVERLAQALAYPAPGGEGLTLRYPFLFTSDLTPPEVIRAMQLHHGLLDEERPSVEAGAPEHVPEPGTVETW